MTQIKRILPIFGFIIATLMFTSCNKKEQIIETITESEAAEIIGAALQSNGGGVTTNLEDITDQLITALSSGQLCDSLYTKSIEKDHQGTQIQAEYSSDFSYEMTCNNFDIPQTATISVATITMYNSPRIISNDNNGFQGNVSGLQPSSPLMTIDGIYSSEGVQDLNFKEQKNINRTLSITLTDISINKQNVAIESGNGAFSFSASNPDETFLYEGNIIFNGNNTATIIINGTSYEIDWE